MSAVWSTACTAQKHAVVVVNTREEHNCCLECCNSDGPQTCSEKSAIIPRTIIHILVLRGRVGLLYSYIFFPHLFEKEKYFPRQLYCFQQSGLWNTPYGKRHASRTEPVYGKLNIILKLTFNPIVFVLPVNHSKARLVVFASRRAIPEFRSFCSP